MRKLYVLSKNISTIRSLSQYGIITIILLNNALCSINSFFNNLLFVTLALTICWSTQSQVNSWRKEVIS